MTLTFNANPAVGDVQQQPNGLQYQYDGVKWTSIGSYGTGNINDIKKLDDISSQFDDVTTTFNLKLNNKTVYVSSELVLNISIGGVKLDPGVDYQINTQAATITFTDAPLKGFSFTGIIESRLPTSEVDDAAITTAKLADDSVTTAKLADDSVTIHQIADNAVGSNQIAAQAIYNSDINNSAAIAQSKLNIADATTSASGYMSGADKTKLDGIESNSTADQTAAEIRTLVESATDSNVFTDADHTKLNNIDVTNDRISVDSNGTFNVTSDSNQYPTIKINHSNNTVEGEVFRFERTDSNNARYHSLKAKSHSSDTDENYLSFHIHDRDSINSQVEQLKITPNSVLLNYDGTTKVQTTATGVYITGNISPTGNLNLLDSSSGSVGRIMLGTDSDLQISHTGSGGIIGNYTGTLGIRSNALRLQNGAGTESYIQADENGSVQLYHDNIKRCETSADGFNLPDNSKLQLGDAQDLKIFHDGSNSRIQDDGTGFLLLDTNTLMIRKVDGSETMAKFVANGAAELYYDGSSTPKAQTSATGLDVTGGVTITDDSPFITFDDTNHNTSFQLVAGGGTLQLKTSTNNGVSYSNAIGIGGVGNIFIPDNDKVNFGSGNDLVIVHDGTDSKITNKTGNLLIEAKDGETGIKVIPEQAVELYYDDVERLSTTSTGALITGATGSDPALHIKHSNINVEGEVIRIGRLDSGARYHSINASQSNTTANNFIKFNIHIGAGAASPYTAQITQLFMDDDKVSLSYNGASRFETTDDGVKVIGNVKASTGILFGSDTADNNRLNDYETGTWTPTVLSEGNIGTGFTCTYTKIGRLVTINADIAHLTDTTSSTFIKIGGLPYVPSGTGTTGKEHSAVCHGERYGGGDIIVAYLLYNSGSWGISFRFGVPSGHFSNVSHSDISDDGTDNNLRFTLTYEIL